MSQTKLKDLKRREQVEVRVLVKIAEERMGNRGPYTTTTLSTTHRLGAEAP